ncbi:MAG TPA: hypothetical protein VNL13_03190 [Sulfolobales archaeon]|nr:hypothetical protein [Sulfolobales archaeon]
MGRYVTVSIKIPREVKEKLESRGIRVSDILRRAIEEEVRRIELEEVEARLAELKDLLQGFTTEFVVRSIREDRGAL